MNVDGTAYRTVWVGDDGRSVHIIDQTRLPHEFVTRTLSTVSEVAEAIKAMRVRGAPLIGATAAYGVCLALAEDPGDAFLKNSCDLLLATRPTAVNLRWAVDKMKAAVRGVSQDKRLDVAYIKAAEISDTFIMVDQNPIKGRSMKELLLNHMVSGDVLTHMYAWGKPIINEKGDVEDFFLKARENGILFDLGHGAGSFWFRIAVSAINQGFLPDTISTDLHKDSALLPNASMNTTMSKCLNMGMTLEDVIKREV